MNPIIIFGKEITINPIAIQLGSINIYWYGIIIALSFLLAFFLLERRTEKRKDSFGIKFDDIYDYSFGAIIFGFICARIYYVLFKLDYYLKNPLEIFEIWNGGIAIYGGIIGAVLYGIYFCKKRKIKFFNLADLLVPYLALAQSMGRWGNFINREAYGVETNLPWKMGIYIEELQNYIYVHPTFLYESIITFSIFIILIKISKKRKFEGQIFYLYMILYGLGRALIEGLRIDSLMMANFRISQVLSVIIVVLFSIIYYLQRNRRLKVSE